MSVTVTNAVEIFMPIVDEITAHTEAMNAIAACQAQAQVTIAQTALCTGVSASDVDPAPEVCCETELLMDTPTAGSSTERVTCSDGSVTETVTDEDGVTGCTVQTRSANPTATSVTYNELGELCTVDVTTSCKPRTPGKPYSAYFIPVVSDFGNIVFCIPGYKYAFAWGGTTSKNLKEQLEKYDLNELNDITLPAGGADSIRAQVGGDPFVCGVQNTSDYITSNALNPVGQDGTGADYYCFPYYEGVTGTALNFAHTVNDPDLAVEPPSAPGSTVAFDNMGDPIPCELNLHPLQQSQQNTNKGCYAALSSICPEWDGVGEISIPDPDAAEGNILDSISNLLPKLIDCDEEKLIEGKTAQEAYYTLWEDWWCCEKRSKQIQQYIYAAQIPVAIYGLITAQATYQSILEKNLSMICATEADLQLIARCSTEILGTEDEPGLLKICQANLLEGHNDRIGTINNRGVHSCDLADDELDCYNKLWKPIQHDHAPQLADSLGIMLSNGKATSEHTLSWAENLQECVSENMMPEMKRQFAPLMQSSNCAANNLTDWREELKDKASLLHDHFNNVYKCPEANMIPVIMDMTTCMVQRTCELRDWLFDAARADDDVYQKGYQQGEIPQAQAAMATSAQLIPKIIESVNWLDTNIPYALDIFKTCYGDPQAKLNPRLYAEATDLAPEITRCFEWFRDNATDYKKFFDDCYRDGECALVKKQLDMACRLASRVEESLERVTEWSLNDREMYTLNFKADEISAIKMATQEGTKASRELSELSKWFDDQAKSFKSTYDQHWLQCDIDNIKEHCAIWTRGNPLQEIERSSEKMRDLSDELLDFHSDGLVKAKTYMDKVFQEADRFDYCIENPAALHVRTQVDRALDELEKCTPRYATGHLLAARMQLKAQGARAEGAAVESATRWKWWANEQQDQRRFDQRIALMGIMDAAAVRGIEASKTQTAGSDLLLTHARDAIIRGQTYLNHMHESGRTTSSIDQNQVDSMLRSVQLSHFWPELALRENGEFNSQMNQMMDDAQNIMQMGHSWNQMAHTEKTSATQVMGQSFDVANRLSQMGQFYLSQAEGMNSQRAQISNQAGTLGNQYAQTGHGLHRLAGDKTQAALSASIQAAQMGLGAGDLGAKHNDLALQIENTMTLNALEHVKAGISSFQIGIDFLQEVRQSYELSGSYGMPAANGLLNTFKHGQNSALLSLSANEQCYEMQYQMLCKAKDYLQKNHHLNIMALHGDNTLASSNELLRQQGDAVGSAFGLLGNSLQGISQNSTPMPFPQGNGAFGFNGGGF